MKKLRKLSAFILAAAMVLTMSSCAGKKSETSTEGTSTTESETASQTSADTTAQTTTTTSTSTTTTTSTTAATTKMSTSSKQLMYDLYANEIDKVREENNYSYFVYDMDADGIPELFVDKDRDFHVFTFKDGLVKVGEFISYGSTLYTTKDGKGLTMNRNLRDTVTLSHITIENGKIKEEDFFFAKNDGSMDDETRTKIFRYCDESLRDGNTVDGKDYTMLKEVVLNGNNNINVERLHEWGY